MNSVTAWLIAVLAAAIPTIIYVLVLWWLDRYEKEPRHLLFVAFIWGAVPAVIVSVTAEVMLGYPLAALGKALAQLMSTSLLAPLIEELAKGLAVLALFLFFRREFDDVLDGIIYGATLGFCFAMTENAFYFVHSLRSNSLQGLSTLVFLRALVFGLNHALFTSVFGAALGYARLAKDNLRRWIVPPLGLLGAMVLHGMHNLFAALSSLVCFSVLLSIVSDWSGVLLILVIIVLAWRQEQRWIATHLKAEVESGLISQEEYDMISSYRRRLAAQRQALSHHGPAEAKRLGRLAQLATELAFKVEQGDQQTAEKLRAKIAALRS